MNTVKHIINSSALNGVISLPKNLQNKKVEVIISLAEEEDDLSFNDILEIDKLLVGSITESLIGSIPRLSMSLDDYRAERLSKYDDRFN